MKKLLLLGKNGQLGIELHRILQGTSTVIAMGKEACDLSKPDTIIAAIESTTPDLIINAAAFTAVDRAESEYALAAATNAVAPGILAEEAKKRNIPFIHYSTDYVFDGLAREPYREESITNPLNVYGETKLAGEQAVQAAGDKFLILRTSWIYSTHGHNFFKTMLRLGNEKSELRIVNDQTGTPNSANDIAEATAQLIHKLNDGPWGIYHMSSHGHATWYEFASAIFALAPIEKTPTLSPITTSEYPTPAIRPAYSVLSSKKLEAYFDIRLPEWEASLSRLLERKKDGA